MTELNELIKWLEDRIDALRDDFPDCTDDYVKGRVHELKFILRHIAPTDAEIAEAETKKLKPAEWIERVLYAYDDVQPELEERPGFGVFRKALETPVDWSDNEPLTDEQYNWVLAYVAGRKPRSDK